MCHCILSQDKENRKESLNYHSSVRTTSMRIVSGLACPKFRTIIFNAKDSVSAVIGCPSRDSNRNIDRH